MVQFVIFTVPVLRLRMPPPPLPKSGAFPLEIVKPEIVTLKLPEAILKMRKSGVPPAVLRCTVNPFVVAPSIVRLLSINNSPLVSVIVLFAGREKTILPSGIALLIAARNEPGPLSSVLVTGTAAAVTTGGRESKRDRPAKLNPNSRETAVIRELFALILFIA